MSMISLIQNEYRDLMKLRDEIRVQAHLAKAEAKDKLARLEAKWPDVESRFRMLEQSSGQAVDSVMQSARDLMDELKSGYETLKRELTPSSSH